MSAAAEFLQGLAVQYGYPGVFAVSVLGSAVPFVPLPYLIVVVLLSGVNDPLLLGLVAGVGGALGKVTSYVLGRLGYFAAGKESRANVDAFQKTVTRYGMLGVFIFALTPLPDDIYVVPMGVLRLPFLRFFIANLLGKIILSVSVAYLGRSYFSLISPLLGDQSLEVFLIAVALTALASIIAMRSDWPLAMEVARTRGITGLVSQLPSILRLREQKGAPKNERTEREDGSG